VSYVSKPLTWRVRCEALRLAHNLHTGLYACTLRNHGFTASSDAYSV
jgi:hypothetical protein